MAANLTWYGIEHADHGNPDNPLTDAQVTASAQILECLATYAGFPLHVSYHPYGRGYGTHAMGGAAWGGHTCPDLPPAHVRSEQRHAIVELAQAIRDNGDTFPAGGGGGAS
jgi:N-acetylmuramoyl-L-alanine amidase